MKTGNLARALRYLPQALIQMGLGRPASASVDIADFCTLECPYCYWLQSTQHEQLSLEGMAGVAQDLRRLGVILTVLVGGEPTLRPDVLEAFCESLPFIWVVTNGMKVRKSMAKGYEDWDVEDLPGNASIIVSLDGVGEHHDSSRNHPGLYDQIKARFFATTRSRRAMTTTTLHQGNRDQPKHLLREWRNSGILGMTFEFATPVGRRADPRWNLVGDDRERVIDELLALKRGYGSFMLNSPFGLEMQRPGNLPSWVGAKNCPTARLSISIDSMGRRKTPCVLGSNPANPRGKKPNCSACGCHVPTVTQGIRRLDLETITSLLWFTR